MSKAGISGFLKKGSEISGEANGNGKKLLMETPETGAFFPAMLMSPSSETCENTHMGIVIGGHNHYDTNSGLYGRSKKGPQINGVAPQWTMGNRVVGDSVGNKEQLLQSVILDSEEQGVVHNPLSCSVSEYDQYEKGILMGKESNQRRFPVGGGQLEQVRRSSWVRKEEREPIKHWSNLFSAPTSSNPKLEFYAPACVEGEPEIHPPAEAILEGVSMWKSRLVGNFLTRGCLYMWSEQRLINYGESMRCRKSLLRIMDCIYSDSETWVLGIG